MASIAPGHRPISNGKGGWSLFGRLMMWAVRNAR